MAVSLSHEESISSCSFSDNLTSDSPSNSMAELVEATLELKKQKKQEIDDKRKTLSGRCQVNDIDGDFWLVGGDFFSAIYLVFGAVESFIPSLAGISAIQTASAVFGVIGGIINIAVGFSCICQGIKELKKGHINIIYSNLSSCKAGTINTPSPDGHRHK